MTNSDFLLAEYHRWLSLFHKDGELGTLLQAERYLTAYLESLEGN